MVGVLAGSLVVTVLFSPRGGDDPVAGSFGDTLDAPIGVLAASLIVLWSTYLVGMWWSSKRIGSGSFVADFGVRFSPIDLLGLPIGIAAQVGLVWVVYVPLRAIWPDTFSAQRLEDTARSLVERSDGGLIVVLVALVVVGAPIVEELFFRGMLQRPLLRAAPTFAVQIAVVVGVAFVFAGIHFRPVELPGLFAFGLVLGVVAWRTGRLGMAILAHFAFNATGVISVL
jgi:uncharacterized protein